MSLDELPRLSDEDRTALDDGYVAIECALTGVPPISPALNTGANKCCPTPRGLGRKRTEFEERAAAVLVPPRRP